jgi:hypothetical protein
MSKTITGSCHCGAIRIEITGKVYGLKHCHCISCRKLHGTAFASNSIVRIKDFRIVSGENDFHDYAIRPDKIQRFCKHCCSPIYAFCPPDPHELYLRTGILDGDIGVERGEYHWWVCEKAPWYQIQDDLPQYMENP